MLLLPLREEAKKGGEVAADRDGSLSSLRWPDGRWEVPETAGLVLASVGCRCSLSLFKVNLCIRPPYRI